MGLRIVVYRLYIYIYIYIYTYLYPVLELRIHCKCRSNYSIEMQAQLSCTEVLMLSAAGNPTTLTAMDNEFTTKTNKPHTQHVR